MTLPSADNLPDDRPAPGEWLNYRGDLRSTFAADVPLGPGQTGSFMWPVCVDYDAATDRTRVGLTIQPPPMEGILQS